MFRFANPEYLYALFVLPALFAVHILLVLRKRKLVNRLGDRHLVRQMMPDRSPKRNGLKMWLLLSAIAVLILMIARPQFGTKAEKTEKNGIELVIALDISNSMRARDVQPSRLAKAKQMLSKIIDKRNNDKVAIVVFAGEAYIQLPLTTDEQSAKLFLQTIDPSLIAMQGTAIGTAIDLAVSCFSGDKDVDKAIVLISDGENLEGDAVEAAERASDAGVRVNVVGIGGSGAAIPVSDTSNETMKDSEGNEVISKLDENTCRAIAEAGKGIYVQADNSNAALKALQTSLEKLRKKEMEGVTYSEYAEKFQYLGWAVLALLLAEVLISEKKSHRFRNVRLFERKNQKKEER